MSSLAIIDYGMGNLRSVQKAFEKLGHTAEVVADAETISCADRLVLPGVGAFRDAILRIEEANLAAPISEHIAAGKPFLGICLGQQLLFEVSYEDGEYRGLGVFDGEVIRLEESTEIKVPHIGWNRLILRAYDNPLFAGLPDEPYAYFVHSYHTVPKDESVVAAQSDHGTTFAAAIRKDNVFATQFHPEKSQAVGLKMLENFASL